MDEGIEHKVRYPPVVAERHLAQDLPFAGLELEYIIQQVLAVVVLVDDRIDLNHERGIFVADKRYLFFQVFEEEHPAVTGAPDLDVGIGIEGIDGDTDLRNHVRERADDFEVAAVGDHRDLRTVFLCGLHDVPEFFWLQDGFAADDVQAEALGNHGGGLDVVGDTRDDVFDLVRVVPYFALIAPLGKAVLAAVVAGFGDVPVDAHGDGSFGVARHNGLLLGLGLGDDDARLDEERTDIVVIFALEHLEGVAVARRYRDNQRLTASWGLVLQDGMLATPIVVPATAPDEGVAEIVNSLVG